MYTTRDTITYLLNKTYYEGNMKIENMYLEIEGQMYKVVPVGENIIGITLETDINGVQQVVQNGQLMQGSIRIGQTEQIDENVFEHQRTLIGELN